MDEQCARAAKASDKWQLAFLKAVGSGDWAAVCNTYLGGHGRSPEQCRHRWEHVLSEGLVKGAFTEDEDEIIVRAMKEGRQLTWMQIAARIPGRIGKQCRERWTNHLDPSLKKGGWTPEEDSIMAEAQTRWGNAWTKIAELLPGRAENAVKNRWNSAFRRNNSAVYDERELRDFAEALGRDEGTRCDEGPASPGRGGAWAPPPGKITAQLAMDAFPSIRHRDQLRHLKRCTVRRPTLGRAAACNVLVFDEAEVKELARTLSESADDDADHEDASTWAPPDGKLTTKMALDKYGLRHHDRLRHLPREVARRPTPAARA
ncbi:RNA polymerase II transcription regulator recruiting protein [Aureococcus anophagefferens]|nr:RNA polymerase II transcription regulator recruiting protein [Aureococcus anophagefferens]